MREIIRVWTGGTRGSNSYIRADAETFFDLFAIYPADYGDSAVVGVAIRNLAPFVTKADDKWGELLSCIALNVKRAEIL